jgi:hypothetical protein
MLLACSLAALVFAGSPAGDRHLESTTGSTRPGRGGVPPLRFLRELACVDARRGW